MRRRAAGVALGVGLALLGCATSAFAECTPERGFGGSGRSDERGFGGTGLRDDRGFGGTGRDDTRGFGGTGLSNWPARPGPMQVFGTVTGFGSVCVNGLQIHYDENTVVERNGVRVPLSVLERGQTVNVDATAGPDRMEATRIELQPAVSGPVTRVDRAGERLEVMYQVVEVPAGERAALRNLRPGDSVDVYGLRDSGGRIRASALETDRPDVRPSVVGVPRALPNGAFAFGRLQFRLEGDAPTPGRAVVATGEFSARRGVLEAPVIRDALPRAEADASVSVETWVTGSDRARLATSSLDLDMRGANLRAEDVAVGSRVWAYGELSGDGSLRAVHIEVEPVGGGAPEPLDREELREARGRGEDDDGDDDDEDEDDEGDEDDGDDDEDTDDDDGGEVDDAGDDDDGPDIDDVDDSGGPDLDDIEGPDLDDIEGPDLDDLGAPDLDDLGGPDLDDVGVPDLDDQGGADLDD